MEALTYIKNLIRDPNIASIAPTSGFGIERLCRKMDFPNTSVVVEYGPATGVITEHVLKFLPSAAKLIAIDTNQKFLDILRAKTNDPRLTIVHDTAEHVEKILHSAGAEQADYVISGIPFTMLPPEVAERIVRSTYAVLKPGGKFLVYQFLKPESAKGKGIHRFLPLVFSEIHREIEFMNLPPLRIYEAVKR